MKVKVDSKVVCNFERTKCDACEFGKGPHQNNKIKTTNKNPMKEREIKKYHSMPVHMMYAYHCT